MNSIVSQSLKVKDLGVIFDQFLNFDEYISCVCRSTHFHLRNIGIIWHLLYYDACITYQRAVVSDVITENTESGGAHFDKKPFLSSY